MCSRKEPVRTLAPREARAAANCSTFPPATSGGAALIHEGRRPRLVSPYRVNCGTTTTSPRMSSSDRFIFPSSSSKMRRW